jgi:hypothetical protein
MRTSRLYVVAAALVISLSGGMAMLTTAPAATAQSNTQSFMYAPDINTTQLCLGITSAKDGGLYPCTYTNDQAWRRGGEIGNSGYYQWINDYGQCLGVAGGSKSKGAQVVGWKCLGTGHPDQYWTIHYLNPETYLCEVFNYNSRYLMQPASNARGAAVRQQPWVGYSTLAQEWVFEINS